MHATCTASKFAFHVQQRVPLRQGKAEIVPIKSLEIPDVNAPGGVRVMLWTVFQRQRFEYVETEKGGGGAKSKSKIRGEVREVATPVDNALSSYLKATRGMSPHAVASCVSRYGDNSLRVPLPTFLQVYKEQLMGPVTVFQVFTVLLWLMDEYWKYALFSACSLLMFEATTAFSRIKNISTLRKMGQAPWKIATLRDGQWTERSTEELVPGDLVSVVRLPGGVDTPIPCDCLILRGSAVVSEASLTGESVPQMKDGMSNETVASDPAAPLDIDGEHRVNALYSGTTLMQQSPGDVADTAAHLPATPDGGCLCYVLQTGFSSTQGKLMRMMEFSSEQVTGDTKETLILLFILLVFALFASGHVFIKGLADGKRSQYELVLRCILILTSVVPPELPMQTAMAVNTALIALIRASVFCTEPFRVPISGKVDTCLFDKTGTLTSDKLVAMGVVSPKGESGGSGFGNLQPCPEANKNVSLVIAGCHSLVQVDGKTFGDPLEQAALMGVKWRFDPKTQTALPTENFKDAARDAALAEAEAHRKDVIAKLAPGRPQPPPVPKPQPPKRSWKGTPGVKILVRNHFSSALQRMSTVAAVTQTGGEGSQDWVLMKGSPEMVATLLADKPKGYDAAYRKLAEQGLRIVSLAHRQLAAHESARLKDAKNPLTRDEMERGLSFDGFLAFACPVRTDTPDVIKALLASSHTVMMATGDSALTALHVANEVGIAQGGLERAMMLVAKSESSNIGDLEWVSAKVDEKTNLPIMKLPYKADGSIPALAKKYSLCVTGASLNAAAALDGVSLGKDSGSKDKRGLGGGMGGLWDYLDSVAIFARMSPLDKECVLKRLKQQGRHTFMCGDGANDVGALKQAHVGVALLSGFGGANTKKVTPVGGDPNAAAAGEKGAVVPAAKAETFQEKMQRMKDAAEKMKEAKQKEAAARKADQADLMEKQKTWFEEELAERTAKGDAWAQFGAMKAATMRMVAEQKKRAAERQKAAGGAMAAPGFAQMMQEMEGMEDMETTQVKLGDASMAAPFTSRIPSVRSAVDIIRQGRCTLVSAIQMQQVLVLSCLISAYSLSVLYLDGIRSSDNQMIASGSALTAASLAFSYATPVHTLSPVRPLRSIFHPANFLSLWGQLAIHLGCMVYAVEMVRAATGEAADFPENIPVAIIPEDLKANATEEQRSIWAQGPPFKPSLLNTVVFLVETVQRVCVMLVNYKGRPFMLGAIENKTLLLSLASMVIGAFVCAFEVSPMLNNWLQLVTMVGLYKLECR
jgi:cation-transporting ATPase 13A1